MKNYAPNTSGNALKSLTALVCAVLLVAGCATPHVVTAVKTSDSSMSCSQIEVEMAEADRFKNDAQKEKGMTGTNVVAALLFWPAMIGTYSNANEAIAAADTRKAHLAGIHSQKKCNEIAQQNASATPEGKTSQKLNELKTMLEKGLISKEEYENKRLKTIAEL